MGSKISFPSEFKLATLLEPAADAAGRTSAIAHSLKNTGKAYLIFHINQGAANTVLLTPMQASAVAKTGGKVLANAVPIWVNLDGAAGDTWVRVADGVNYTTDAGVKIKQVCFEIDPAMLDMTNNFDCIYAVTGASAAGNITSAQVLHCGMRFQGGLVPSVITD